MSLNKAKQTYAPPPPIVSCHEGVRRFAVPLFVLLLTEVYLVDQSHKLWGEAAHQRNGEMILWRLFQMQLSIVITENKLGISNIFLLSSSFFLCLKYTHDCVYQVSVLQGYLHLLWYLPYAFTVAVFFLSRACTTHSCFQCCCIFAIWWYMIKVVDVKMSDLIKLFIIYTHQLSLLDTDSFTECDPTFRNTSLWVSESITNL